MAASSNSSDDWTIKDYLITGVLLMIMLGFCDRDAVKSTCSTCDGEGVIECNFCYGDGHKDCSYCYGKGNERCGTCSGDGRISGYIGGDDGFQYVYVEGNYDYYQVSGGSVNATCKECSGDGTIECSIYSCDDGKVKCNYCYGKGEKTCSPCSGSGKK